MSNLGFLRVLSLVTCALAPLACAGVDENPGTSSDNQTSERPFEMLIDAFAFSEDAGTFQMSGLGRSSRVICGETIDGAVVDALLIQGSDGRNVTRARGLGQRIGQPDEGWTAWERAAEEKHKYFAFPDRAQCLELRTGLAAARNSTDPDRERARFMIWLDLRTNEVISFAPGSAETRALNLEGKRAGRRDIRSRE